MSGLDVHYDLGSGHPLLGRRMPDLDLVTESGTQRVFTLLHDARPLFLDLAERNSGEQNAARPGPFDLGLVTELTRLVRELRDENRRLREELTRRDVEPGKVVDLRVERGRRGR
jgi:hypothetical protein